MEQSNGLHKILDTGTLVPIGAVLGFIMSVAGMGYVWGTTNSKVEKLDVTVAEQSRIIQDTRERLIEVGTINTQLLQAISDLKNDIHYFRSALDKGFTTK